MDTPSAKGQFGDSSDRTQSCTGSCFQTTRGYSEIKVYKTFRGPSEMRGNIHLNKGLSCEASRTRWIVHFEIGLSGNPILPGIYVDVLISCVGYVMQ